MQRLLLRALMLASLSAAARLPAQEIERPVAFDTAGRVMTITPALAARLKLSPPAWPVSGDFVEARLYDRGGSSYVLVVQRSRSVNERYALSADQRADLQRAISTGLAATGNLSTGERQDVISEPAKGQFTRDQTLAAALFYGPALAALTENGATATAVYLATVGATFFTAANLAKNRSISKAQNHMATNGAFRGALIAGGLLYVAAGDSVSGDVSAVASLAGAITGTIIGFRVGKPLTDGEAHGATFGSTITTLTTAGVLGTLGGFQGDEVRPEVAGLIGAALVGYPVGLRYVRRSSYAVTPGDVTAMSTASLLGVVGAATLIPDNDPSEQAVAATLTAGLLAGTFLGDRVLVRPYDFTQSQGRQMGLGALAGSLMGFAVPLAAKSDSPQAYFGAAALGGVIGMGLTKGLIEPATGSGRPSPRSGAGSSARSASARAADTPTARVSVRLHPENVGLLFAKGGERRRAFPLMSLTF